MKNTLITSLLLFLIACSTSRHLTNKEICGKYVWNGMVYGVSSEIILNDNQSFEYNWLHGLIKGRTLGTWKKEGQFIVLNSNIQANDVNPFEILETKKYASEILTLKLKNSLVGDVAFAKCILKKDTTVLSGGVSDMEGNCSLYKLKADSLIITTYGYNTIRIPVDSMVSEITFKLVEDFDKYRYFTNEKWKFKKGRLFDTSKRKSRTSRKFYYEKIK